jgi:hypothetical protein
LRLKNSRGRQKKERIDSEQFLVMSCMNILMSGKVLHQSVKNNPVAVRTYKLFDVCHSLKGERIFYNSSSSVGNGMSLKKELLIVSGRLINNEGINFPRQLYMQASGEYPVPFPNTSRMLFKSSIYHYIDQRQVYADSGSTSLSENG